MRSSVSTLAITAVVSQNFLTLSPGYTTVTPSSANSSVSRAGNATLFDSTGKLTWASNNLLLRSQEFDNVIWTKNLGGVGSAPVVTPDAGTAPDGTATADRIVFTLNGGTAAADVSDVRQAPTTLASKYIFSFWIKSFDGVSSYNMLIRDANGFVNSIAVSGAWTRVSTVATYAAGTSTIGFGIRGGQTPVNPNTADVLVWGAQLEAVTYQTTPSTYVATTASAYYGPRYDYNPSTLASKGLLVEAAATNALFPSNGTTWNAATMTVAGSAGTSPDGTNNAIQLTATGTNGSYYAQFTGSNATVYTGSVWLKRISGTGQVKLIDASGARRNITITSDWVRYNTTATSVSTTPFFGIELAVSGDVVQMFGGQTELGSFATSYIPTTSASVTRAAETYTRTAYASQLVMATYTDEQTGSTYYVNLNPGNTWAGNGWITSLRAYDGTAAAVPTWLDVSATTGNRMLYDSTGKLTYAPANMFLQSQTIDNASWTKNASTVTADTTAAPDGTTTADTLTENTTTASHNVAQSVSLAAGLRYAVSFYAKPNGRPRVCLYEATSTGLQAIFDVSSGTYSAVNSVTAFTTIQSAGNGWYRCTLVFTAGITGNTSFQIMTARSTDTGYASYLGDGTSGLYLWGFQCEPVTYQTLPSTYIPTTTAAYYGPRFDYDPSTLAAKGLLIEESRANLALQSNAFTTTWSQLSTSQISLTANALASPDGTANSWKLQANSATGVSYGVYQSYTYTAAAYTASIYAKAGTTSNLIVDFSNGANAGANFNLSTGSVVYTDTGVTASIQNIGNGWYRCIATKTLTAATGFPEFYLTNSNSANVRTWNAAGTEYVYVYGYQLELGSFATSYIPTTTASVTRAADVIKLSGAALTTLKGAAGSLILETKDNAQTGWSGLVSNFGGAIVPAQAHPVATRTYNGTVPLSTAVAAPTLTPARIAVSWSATGRSIVQGGNAVASDANLSNTSSMADAYLGSGGNQSWMDGHIASLSLYNQRLPNATLQSKSVVGSPL